VLHRTPPPALRYCLLPLLPGVVPPGAGVLTATAALLTATGVPLPGGVGPVSAPGTTLPCASTTTRPGLPWVVIAARWFLPMMVPTSTR
jgi:hypothetical protein